MPFWSTLDVPTEQQFGYWREVLCEAFITLNPSRKSGGAFSGSVAADLVSEVNVTRLLTEEHRVIRDKPEIRKTPLEYYFVNMQIKGDVIARQRGRETLIRPNEFYIVDSTEPYDLDYRSDLEIYSFRVPKRKLEPLLKDPARQTAVRVSRETPMGLLAVNFLQSVLQCSTAIPPAAGKSVANMIAELVALSLGASTETSESAADSARHALLAAILKFIEAHLHDPALSVETTCRRFGISQRYLHRVFETAEMTFGGYVRSRRLELCAAELLRLPDSPISSIALSSGFNDVSHFNHCFRKRFGSSPREYRHLSRPDL
ncbi:helix-turn-helix domain-containing protein [Bradyrhizobium commune]|uniref:Helix-turn-helix domain-containing protein n=1 Tax=Bradyrhizobium commune TaxID=83627 RepID=A0A7S9H073_9BRAD|nr:helix-turn-helix domain-containing protein [Bradyrhizobium commune]QPF91420.1 helix-turn-helix domain-containing protein [Bradyrhizobium commune]